METKIDQTIQYGQMVKRDSEYRYTKVIQNTGGDSLEIKTASQTSTFEIPVVGFNLAKSSINFTQVVPENTTDARFAHAFRHTPPWSRVELYTRGGTYLMDVTNFSNVYTAFGQRTKKIEDFHGSDNGIVTKAGINDLNIRKTITGVASNLPGVPGTGDVTVQWKILGSELYNTIMSLDKTLILGEVLNLRITWNPAQNQGYWSTTAGSGTPINIGAAAAVNISNLALYLAQEANPTVLNELSQVVSTQGMSVLIPYTHAYKTSLGDALTSHAISIRLSRGHGVSLERIYTLFGSGAEEKNTRFNASIAANTTSFYSLLNSKRMQEFDVNVASGDYDWMKTGEKKDRVVSLLLANDNTLFAHSDNWCGDDLECAVHQHIGGLSLDMEQKYDLYVTRTGGGPLHYYTAAVCQKQLMVGPGGVQVM